MKLRQSIECILLAVAVLAALPTGVLHAAEAAPDTASSTVPRLIDPQSPPPSERGASTAPPVNSGASQFVPGPSPAIPPPGVPAPATLIEADPSVLNQRAVDDIELQMNADVLKYIAFFTGAGRSTFERWLKRSGRYMELFRTVLQKEGLPPDLVHLVFVESGFNINARSYAAAVGPWQFLRSSARYFGLNVNQWVDERKDPEKATVAAARYLKHLYGIFGDWPLALASYNAGEGTVMRAIKHQGTTNYWELRLPKQTEDYVPQFMAALAISRDPVKYGFGDIELDDPMRFDEVALKGAVDLRAIAKLANCSYEELKELNPSARTSMLSGPNGITTVRVPEGKSEIIQRNLSGGAELPRVNLTVRHRVKRDETLRKIAEEYAVSPTELARVNNLGRGRPLRRGMLLTVPSSFRAPKPEVLSADSEDPRASTDYVPRQRIGLPGKINGNSTNSERVTHVVKSGETLRSIAAKYGVSVTDLRQWNRVTTPSVKLGTRLRIRSGEPGDSTMSNGNLPVTASPNAVIMVDPSQDNSNAKDKPVLHTVGRGETVTSIATRYRVAPADLRTWNKLAVGTPLRRGQVLAVSGATLADESSLDQSAKGTDGKLAKGAPRAQATHTVREGETLTAIATRHGVTVDALKKLNKLTSTVVTKGQRLRLPA